MTGRSTASSAAPTTPTKIPGDNAASNHDLEEQVNAAQLRRPGWSIPINRYNKSGCAPSVGSHSPLLTQREIAMMGLVNSITDKPEWDRKVFEEGIVSKWKDEIVAREDRLLTGDVFDWCMQELRDKADQFRRRKFLTVFDTRFRVAKSDTIVSDELRQELVAACQHLLDVPEAAKDYHPGSDGQVLNLIHPSLFPLVYGRSRILDTGAVPLEECSMYAGKGRTIQLLAAQDADTYSWRRNSEQPELWSKRYQWLPSEVKFDHSGKSKITSYINNLHPVGNEGIYSVLQQFVDAAIPLWNECLPVLHPSMSRDDERSVRIDCDGRDLCDPAEPEWIDQASDDDEDEDVYSERLEERWRQTRKIIHPTPVSYDSWQQRTESKLDLRQLCREDGLQVIFKLASIELTPDKPRYAGGNWHVEGQLSEHIAATALYYYDCSNVTEARLDFRQEWNGEESADLKYVQNIHDGVIEVFGLAPDEREGPAVQDVGSAVTKQGRMLVFPNTFQHRVAPFELADGSEPGHRRFLVMWLVDPWNRIVSTVNVPPQQQAWWVREMVRTGALPLPAELVRMVGDELGAMSIEEARAIRLDLMAERTALDNAAKGEVTHYSLCEH